MYNETLVGLPRLFLHAHLLPGLAGLGGGFDISELSKTFKEIFRVI